MTAGQTIDYEALAQEAMRGLVRNVLVRTAKSGLPGDHHFYISFDTGAPGVSLSKRLKEKYPREMTIVLQHRFWDLVVSDERFEVKLTFDGIPERLVVPFSAIKVFFDPSVRYGLQFEDPDALADPDAPPLGLRSDARPGRPTAVKKPRAPRKTRADRERQADQDIGTATAARHAEKSQEDVHALTAANGVKPKAARNEAPEGEADGASDEKPEAATGAQILSLDQFRKK